jgi:hypothetical protein
MMWHWNSLWAPAPGDPPAVDDPALWQTPWSTEQAIALQARSWEAMLSASHSWWSMLLSSWPLATGWPLPAWSSPTLDRAATAGAEPLAAKPAPAAAAPAKRAAPRKRTTSARKR